MRNFKKFLALVLATMMVLGGMVTVSAAEETAAAESVDYDAIYQASAEDLNALDILKGDGIDFALQNGVTRWQMALFVARIMTGETNDLYWSKVTDNTTPFDDVTNYFGAISYVSENGIVTGKGWIAGVGDNCFDPNGEIKVEEALTMAVRALGYKQLQYPQGFMTVAEDLGLTDGLEDLAIGTALTRGQMVQILKNMLYVKVDGAASFAQQNFGLKEDVYVIVATNLQYMIGAERVTKNGYVALAKLNADGTYDYSNYIHVTEAELGLEKGEGERKIGYSYIVSSFDNYAGVYSYAPTPTATFQNYGDEKNEIQTVNGYNYVQNDKYVKIDGVQYELVKSYTNLNNKSTSIGNNDGELIVHSYYKGAYDTAFTYYRYDLAGNILDENGNVAIYYNQWLGTYYTVLSGSIENGDAIVRVATDDDFAKYAISLAGGSTEMYGVVTSRTDLTTIQFSEITMIDDNSDGKYDRAIYIPYSVGVYGRKTNSKTMYTVSTSTTNGSQTAAAPTVNGVDITMVTTNRDGYWVEVNPSKDAVTNKVVKAYVRESDINFINNKPKADEYIVYYYNVYSRDFVVVENLGTAKSGTVTSMTQGTYSYDTTSQTYYYKGATVTVDGEVYGLGYRPYATRSQLFLNTISSDYVAGSSNSDLQYIDADLANYGYSTEIYKALMGQTYRQLAYVVLADRLIFADDASTNTGWIAFDYGYYTKQSGSGSAFTSYAYTGDIAGVDEDGNILVKAYADESGDKAIVKIGTINGFNYGLLVDDYAALQYQFSGIGILNTTTAYNTMKKCVIRDFFSTLAADLNGGEDTNNANARRQYVYIVSGVSADGVYDIYTDLNLYWGTSASLYRQPDTIDQKDTITFVNGISTAKVAYDANGNKKVIVLDTESVILVAGKNGLKVATGIPEDYTATINFSSTNGTAVAYNISSDLIFVASKDMTCEEIYPCADWDNSSVSDGYTYYMVLGRADANYYDDTNTYAVGSYDATVGKVVYTYSKMYNINTGALETLTLTGDPLKGYEPAYANTWTNMPKPIGAIYAEKDGVYTLLTTLKQMNVYYSAVDCVEVLTGLLYNGYDANNDGVIDYAPIYDNVDRLGSKAASSNIINLVNAGTKGEYAMTFNYDELHFYGDNKSGYTRIDFNNNRATTNDDAGAAIYYNYEKGVSFTALAIDGDDTFDAYTAEIVAKQLAGDVFVTTVAQAVDAAILALTTQASASTADSVKTVLTNATTAIKAAAALETTTVADIQALQTVWAGKIQEALIQAGVDADTAAKLAAAKEDAIDKVVAACEGYDADMIVTGTKTVADRIDDYKAAINAATSVADTYIADIETVHIPFLTQQLVAAKKAVDDAAALLFNASATNTETATVITVKNVPSTAQYLTIKSADANGLYTTEVVKVTLGSVSTTNVSGMAAVWARDGVNATLTLTYADAYGSIPALTAGTYSVEISHSDNLVQAMIVTIG